MSYKRGDRRPSHERYGYDPALTEPPPYSAEFRQMVHDLDQSRMNDPEYRAAMLAKMRPAVAASRERYQDALSAGYSESVVYFMRLGTRIKIGYTARLQERLSVIQPEEVLGLLPGGRAEERELHKRFAQYRVVGEWFEDVPEIRDYIRQHVR